jgi:putative tryptophan/tyrosine transport system substrate-binding protein
MAIRVRRREFLATFASSAVWPLAVRAQQREIPTIGFISAGSHDDSGPVLVVLRQGLKDAGLIEGYKVRMEFRWAQDEPDRLPALASDLVARNVALIFAVTNAAAVAAKAATTTIPIVFAIGGDPVSLGLVSSIEAPGGNATGVTNRLPGMYSKRLEILRQLEPKPKTIGILLNPANPTSEIQSREVAEAVAKFGLELRPKSASTESDLEIAFRAFAEPRVDVLIIPNDAFFNSRRQLIVKLAALHSIPTLYPWREFVDMGGLMSFGPDLNTGYRMASVYANKILKGADPAKLPVMQPNKFYFVINSKTAKALGISIPKHLLASASQLIN